MFTQSIHILMIKSKYTKKNGVPNISISSGLTAQLIIVAHLSTIIQNCYRDYPFQLNG